MDFLDILRANLEALLAERSATFAELDSITATAGVEGRAQLTDDEENRFGETMARIEDIDQRVAGTNARIDQIVAARSAQDAAVAAMNGLAARATDPAGGRPAVRVGNEPSTYHARGEHSFFWDLTHRSIDPGAADRIARNQREMQQLERRTGTTANLAGLTPPQYLVDLFAPIIRSGRITAGIVDNSIPLPPLGTSFNFGRGTTGTLVGAQSSENASLSNQDYDDTLTSFALATIGGYTEVSRQEIDRSAGGDQIIIADLAAVYANELNRQVVAGSGSSGQLKGILSATGTGSTVYTDASPTFAELWPKINGAIATLARARQLPPTAIVMSPERWQWICAAVDTTGRPMLQQYGGQAFNAVGNAALNDMVGLRGELCGLPVYVDPSVPVNLGGGTNEDRIIVGRFNDAKLMEDDSVVPYRVYEEPGSAALTLRFVVAGYAAFTAERYAVGFNILSGTGLATPTF